MKKTVVFKEVDGQRIAIRVSNIAGLSEFDDHCALTIDVSGKIEVYAVEGSFDDNHRTIEEDGRSHFKKVKDPWGEPRKDQE
jgi:hypothetical protein